MYLAQALPLSLYNWETWPQWQNCILITGRKKKSPKTHSREYCQSRRDLGPDPTKTYVHIYTKLYTVTGQSCMLFLQLQCIGKISVMDCFGVWPFRLHLTKWLMGQYGPEEILPTHAIKINYIHFYRPIFYFCHYISRYFSLYLFIQMNPFAMFFKNYFIIIFIYIVMRKKL